ncbi:MAG: hypothetical protein JW779_01665, partial [Candidatus Thorarchaeota archaeon]|nr:hypothetical protein [Candidatus Thorarchaeota archaeon]
MKELLNQSLREHILSQISPTEDEIRSQQEAITNLTRVLVAYASSMGIDYAFILPQGSTGKKQTQLKGASDIDLFVGLRPENYEKVLSLPTKQRDKELDALFDGLVENWF